MLSDLLFRGIIDPRCFRSIYRSWRACKVRINQGYVFDDISLSVVERLAMWIILKAFHYVLPLCHSSLKNSLTFLEDLARESPVLYSVVHLFWVRTRDIPSPLYRRFSCIDFLVLHPATYSKQDLAWLAVQRGSLMLYVLTFIKSSIRSDIFFGRCHCAPLIPIGSLW